MGGGAIWFVIKTSYLYNSNAQMPSVKTEPRMHTHTHSHININSRFVSFPINRKKQGVLLCTNNLSPFSKRRTVELPYKVTVMHRLLDKSRLGLSITDGISEIIRGPFYTSRLIWILPWLSNQMPSNNDLAKFCRQISGNYINSPHMSILLLCNIPLNIISELHNWVISIQHKQIYFCIYV